MTTARQSPAFSRKSIGVVFIFLAAFFTTVFSSCCTTSLPNSANY